MPKKLQGQTAEHAAALVKTKSTQAAKTMKIVRAGRGLGTLAPLSKSDRVLALLKQARGASLDELMKATKWQAHSVRGFLSGAVRKQKGLTVLSERDGQGIRRYRIETGAET